MHQHLTKKLTDTQNITKSPKTRTFINLKLKVIHGYDNGLCINLPANSKGISQCCKKDLSMYSTGLCFKS